MKLKRKYQLLLISAILSVPVIVLTISVLMSIFYKMISKNSSIPFHESYAYYVMLLLFLLSFILLAFLYSRSIHSLLNKIIILNRTIRKLAENDKEIPNKIEAESEDELGELIQSVNLLIDRTTFRELEMKQQMEIKKELLSKLRHDINTPLTAMRLQLFYLEEEFEKKNPLIESLNNQIEYIAGLTDELNVHSFDRIESSHVVMSEVNISLLLEAMVSKWSYLYSIEQIQLIYNRKAADMIMISNDLWLQRLFDNIFQNTLRHSKASNFKITIDHSGVTLIDNGRGFDRNHKGSGLGIHIIDDIAKVLHIDYTVESSSEGTLYHFKVCP